MVRRRQRSDLSLPSTRAPQWDPHTHAHRSTLQYPYSLSDPSP